MVVTNVRNIYRLVLPSEEAIGRDTGSIMQALLIKMSDIIVKAKVP